MKSKWTRILIALLVFAGAGVIGEYIGRAFENYLPPEMDIAGAPIRKGLGFGLALFFAFMLLGIGGKVETVKAVAAAPAQAVT